MAFDPDAYLANTGGFDPDAYLANSGPVEKEPTFAEKASALVTPKTPEQPGIFNRLYSGIKEQYIPTLDSVKRFISPQPGQFGLSRFLQQEGENLQKNVASIAPKTAEILPPLTPQSAAQQIGGGVITDIGIPGGLSAIDTSVVAPLQQLITGIPGKEWLRLSDNLKSLIPSFLGGAPSKKIAGESLKAAEEASGMFKSALPSGLNKEYALKFLDTLKTYTAQGTERGLTTKELSNPKVIDSLIKELTPQETFTLREAVNNTLNEWVPGKRSTEYYQFSALKDALNTHVEEIAPLVRKAQQIYADSAQRAKLLNIFPRTKYGEPAIGRLVGTSVASGLAGASAYGDPVEMAKRALATLMIASPLSNTGARLGATLASRTIPVSGRLGFQAILAKSREERKNK